MSSFDEIRAGLLKKYNVSPSTQTGNGPKNGSENQGVSSDDSDFYTIRKNLLDKYSEDKVEERRNSVSDWAKRYNIVMKGISRESDTSGSWYTRQAIDSYGSEIDSLVREYNDIKDYADRNGLPNAFRYAKQLQEIQKAIQKEDSWYQKYRGSSVEDVDSVLANMGEGEERDWLTANRYEVYRSNADFDILSKTGLESYEAEKAAQSGAQETKKSFGDILIKALSGAGNPGQNSMTEASFQLASDKGYQQPREDWTEDQRSVYGYLYAQDKERAAAYAQEVNDAYNAQAQEAEAQKTADFALKHRVLSTAGSIAGNAAGFGMADITATMLEKIARGTVTQKDYLTPHQYTETATGAISQDLNDRYGTLNENIPVLGGKGLGDAYQIANSFLTSMATAHTVGTSGLEFSANELVSGLPTDLVFFGNAAASMIYDAKEKGATDDQAIAMGLIAGCAEALGEHYSVSHLLGLENSETVKPFLKSIFSQAFVEGEEEVFTSFINNLADYWIMGDKSQFKTLIAEYLEANPDAEDKDAMKYALMQMGADMAFDFLGGALSGGAGGVVADVVNNSAWNKAYHDTYGTSQQELVSEAMDIDPDRKAVQKASQKLDSGKDLSGRQIRQIVESNDRITMEQAVKQRLAEMGETGDTDTISRAITKQARNEDLSWSEKQALKNSSIGDVVAREVKSGEIWDRTAKGEEAVDTVEKEVNPVENTEKKDAPVDNAEKKDTPVHKEVFTPERPETIQETPEESSVVEENEAEEPVTLESLSRKYGAQSKAMQANYIEWQDVEEYDRAFQMAYDMGKAGVSAEYARKSEATSYLSESQRELAYQIGADAASAAAKAQAAQNASAANGKTGWHKGTVRGDGVKMDDLIQTFNDPQRKAYKALCTIAEATGIDIVLYKSQANEDDRFEGDQGKFIWKDNTIYIDVNAGLSHTKDAQSVSKYAMLRTFGHEFTHFIEKWNPEQYNEFRKAVFSTMEDPAALIETKLAKDSTGKMTYDDASREVVSDGMTDILEDSQFLQELANKHKSVFEILKAKLQEFVETLKSYFKTLAQNGSREAKQLKKEVGDNISYLESIVKQFDEIAVQAVENYQKTVAEDEQVSAPEEEVRQDADEKDSSQEVSAPIESNSVKNDSIEQEKQGETETSKEAEPVSNTKYDGFSITPNTERGTLEIRFDSKPSESVRDCLKANKFRWSSKYKLWYGKGNQNTIADLIQNADSNVEPAQDLPQQIEKPQETPASEKNLLPEETTPAVENNKEESVNVQETEPVLPDVADRQGTARLLDDVQDGDVQSDAERGDALGSADERGRAAGQHGRGSDTQRDERRRSPGSCQSGDLRDGGVTPQESSEPTPLQREVSQEIEKKSTPEPGGSNFVIRDSLDLPSGEKGRYKANVDAIRLVKQLEAEKRNATAEEQAILSKYVGWGGLSAAFDSRNGKWTKEYQELKELLSDQEYKDARGSTLNAHYTNISVIKAMYDGLNGLGFHGGRMLEPASGVGNFVGAMPAEMSQKVKSWTMVELDSITGLIAKHLYPHADVRIQGFEKANIANNSMDVAISNVPFGNYAVVDKAYPKKVTGSIHNYFFAKSLDKVRPGGIVMFITSSYTMDSSDSTVRKYIMQRADLLGAIRLPNSAFKSNAGTEVVTDILVLKKRSEGTAYSGQDFLEAPYVRPNPKSYNGAYINSYFTSHPEMVLGTANFNGGMYHGSQLTYDPLDGRGSLADQIREAFTHMEGKMDYPERLSREKTNFAVERETRKAKKNSLTVKDGKVYQYGENGLSEVQTPKGYAERISGMLGIRDLTRDLMNYQQQGVKDSEIQKARKQLNEAYDTYVAKYGFLNAQANRSAIKIDPDYFSILALENWNPETKKAAKSDIFTKNTIAPNHTVTSVRDVSEGLIVSVNQTGGVDADLIARLTGKTADDVKQELIDSRKAFKTVNGTLEAAERYLSGNVRAKLREAEAMAPIDPDFRNNVDALKSVMPKDVAYHEIFVNPGTPWIPGSVYSDFAAYMLGGSNSEWRQDVDVTRNAETGNFTVELKNARLKWMANNTQKWGTSSRSFLDLFDAMLNSKSVVVKRKTVDDRVEIDQDATAAANEKVEEIKKEFQEWLWKDESRRIDLERLYNETFNSIVTPKYNGDNLTVNGANATKPLRPHQRNAVQRIISSGGNTLLAHKVGAGKTYEMAAAAMKLKELGLIKKPMFTVPKSLVAQWGNEFKDFFPTAKLLVAEAGDFTANNRKIFANRIANGDYDAVIVSYEQFERLPISDSFALELYQEQIDGVIAAIEEAKAEKGGKSLSVKDLEKKRKSLQAKIDKLSDSAKDADNISFEELGIDSLFVDEAHNFKNLFYTTSMSNVAGLGNKDGSKRAFDLYTKVRYLQKLNGGKGIVFATATPVMNSMSEMYIMQKYLQPDLLNQLGLNTFDAWAKQFGEVVNGVEIKPSGQGYRVKQSFSRFKNMSELQLLFRNFADVLTDIPGLKIPKMKGGKVNVVVCEPGQFQKDYMKLLEERADHVKNVDPSIDNMLKITSDGRKISYTQRMIDPSLPYEAGCKVNRCIENVAKVYKENADSKGTQMIFCDMATPKGKSSNSETETVDSGMDMESARIYEDIKSGLVRKGIPAKEIAFIHDADTDAKKKKLQADVNEGKIRVLIGSTGKMGVGLNAQKRIVAIHHLDAPWRPGDVEQRNGRAYRQGNVNEEVECFTYVTEGSFDARLWDILERKQNFIDQVMNGENVGREAEDTGEVTLSAAEVKALASGSPLIMEQVQLDTDIKKLESLYRAYNSAKAEANRKKVYDVGSIQTMTREVENAKKDIAARTDTFVDGKFSMTIGKKTFTDKKEAGIALMAASMKKANLDDYVVVGEFAGFPLKVLKTAEGIRGVIVGSQNYNFKTYPGNTTYMINHIASIVEGLDEKVKSLTAEIENTRTDMAEQDAIINAPFAKQAELDQKRARYSEVMEILNPKQEQTFDEDMEKEQHQERTNTLTDREVLYLAAEAIQVDNLTDAESYALQIFRDRLGALDSLQNERQELGRTYKEQQFGENVDRKAAAQTLEKMRQLDSRIQEADKKVISAETAPALRKVLPKARRIVEQKQKEHDDETLRRWRDRRNNAAAIKKYRERISKNVTDISNWIISPSNKTDYKHVPDVLKNTVIPFLTSIDFSSKQQLRGGEATQADSSFMARLKALNAAMRENIKESGLYSGYNDLPPDFMDKLQHFIDSAQEIVNQKTGQFVINQMTSKELKELSEIVSALKLHIQNFNRFHANAVYQHVYDAGDATIRELGEYQDAKSRSKIGETMNNFVFWQQIRPAYAFERFGSGGKAIYDGLRRGQAKLAFNTKEIVEFAEKAYTAEEVNRWEKEIKTVQIGDKTVRMKVSQIMSFYELLKREQARGHIFGQGIRVATYINGKEKISNIGQRVTLEDANNIISVLSPRQIEVADNLQKFMQEKGGQWGNYVSVKRFGERLFGEEHYFPINSDGRHLEANADEKVENASLYALLNMGFTKKLQEKANNRLVLYSIFDVFSNHMASMAQYNALALPVLDALKWFNYQQKEDAVVVENGKERVIHEVKDSVRDQLDRVYGVPEETRPGSGKRGYAENFIVGILKAFNGTETQGISSDSAGLNSLRQYNMAQVAYNLRVVVQQPMAITRAAMVIDYGSILRGMKLSPSAIKKNITEMQKYSGIAAWKGLGFYDTNISRGLTDIIKHNETFRDKLGEVGMLGAEKADQLTWAAMWSACKEEVQRKHGIRPGNEHFYEAVSSLFEEVIYKTQVVDSVLTKNEYLRSKGFFARATGSFMSEPTTTASMLADAFDKYRMDLQKKGATRRDAWEKNWRNIGRTAYVYGIGAVILAAVQAVADAFRDDDKYEKYGDKWQEAFIGNFIDELMPFNKLPLVSDFYDLAKELLSVIGVDTYGYSPSSFWMQWYDSLVKGVEIIYKKITKDETNRYTWYGGVFKLLQAVSGITGLPMAAATREFVAAWNNTIGQMAPSYLIRSYEQKPETEIKYSYMDGYLTQEEAVEELLSRELVDNEDEAYWTIREWDSGGEDFSRYDAINQAVRNGASITEEMAELTSHGYTEEKVLSQIKTSIGKWYQDGEITKQQATNMLTKYFDMTSEEVTATVNKWSCKVVTGIAYDDIKDAYMDGQITKSRAVDMYVRYGGNTQQEATEKVAVYEFVKNHPDCDGISYSAVESYQTYCLSTGMKAETFYDAWKYNYATKADVDANGESIVGSKKAKVLAYVNGMNLTYAQKDSLYYAFGWAQSTIDEAPWH